jgi:energy-coupling factor transporter ATP-binding protein EcfA2
MSTVLDRKNTTSTPSGEGERRAQRGYVPQYDLSARVIYEELAAGRLRWIGLADRNAGTFDDLVLGLHDRIVAYQLKTSRDPIPFNIRTILLDAKDLLGRMLEARRKLRRDFPTSPIEIGYACDDYPRTDDNICKDAGSRAISSAAFIRAHEAHRLSWSLSEWRASPFAEFVLDVQVASQLDDQEFEVAWRNTRFLVGGQHRSLGFGNYSAADDRRLRDLATLLPRLVADPIDRDRWPLASILSKLGWRDPFGLRHGHAFPIDAFYQSNGPTQAELHRALSAATSGYVSLVGPSGSGKSTLLAAGLVPTNRAVVVRYLAFVPNEGQGLGRAEAFDFLHDLVTQFKQQNLGTEIIPGSELAELRVQLETLLNAASARFQSEGIRTLVVVDGLDHVPREERPQHSFLCELPLPQAVPEGVVFLLGTQRLDLPGLPPSVRDQAALAARSVPVAPLPREAISRLADAAGIPINIDRREIYTRTAGHPLSARYVIEGLVNAGTPERQQEWLQNGPAYGGDVNAFYQRAWHDLEGNAEAQRALAYVALAEGPIRPISLDTLVGAQATDHSLACRRTPSGQGSQERLVNLPQ